MRWSHSIERGSFRGWLASYGKRSRVWFKTQIAWRSNHCLFEVGFDEEDSLVTLCVALLPIFLHFGFAWPRRFIPRGKFGGDISVIRIAVHGGALWWQFWRDQMGWSSDVPKWRDGNFNPMDFVFGRRGYSEEVLQTSPVSIDMPEGSYPGTVKLLRSTWKRPRGWWVETMARANIEVPNGVPFPGKGENSWDCGEDAVFGMTCQAATIQEAVGALRASVMRDRKRYGGTNWRPSQAEMVAS